MIYLYIIIQYTITKIEKLRFHHFYNFIYNKNNYLEILCHLTLFQYLIIFIENMRYYKISLILVFFIKLKFQIFIVLFDQRRNIFK